MSSACVLPLLALLVELVSSFSWDIVVGGDKRLEFYYNGTLTHTEDIPSAGVITSVTYDPVQYRVLFADYDSPNVYIFSFDIATRKIETLVTRKSTNYSYVRVAYDPVTQLLFWKEGYSSINSFSLNPAFTNKAVDGNLIITSGNGQYYFDIAVDSCGGYIYWITQYEVERARFDGSGREVLIGSNTMYRVSLALDQQTQKMYWIEVTMVNTNNYQVSIESADFNGKNRITIFIIARNVTLANSLAVSKDFIYWKIYDQVEIWQLPKNPSDHVEAKLFSVSTSKSSHNHYQRIAANYKIAEQTLETKSCEALKSLKPINLDSASGDDSLFCIHGTRVSGESRCECTQGYTGDRCDVSMCHNYCFQGDCSVSAEGKPTCRCNAGYSGERCEVNTCHKYCLHNGVCFLNEEDVPVCECSADYEGVRCDVATTHADVHADNMTPQVLRDLYSALKQVIKEELKHTQAQIQKCEESITDIKNRFTDLHYHDETTPKTQTSN